MRTPDLMPILSQGAHSDPSKGACVMEMASYLAGEEWSDSPVCTHPVLAVMARRVNDLMSDEDRGALLDLLPRLMGTTPVGSDAERKHLSEALAMWCAYAAGDTTDAGDFTVIAHFATNAAFRRGMDPVALLIGLLDEYDRLTARTAPASLTADDTTRLVQLTHA